MTQYPRPRKRIVLIQLLKEKDPNREGIFLPRSDSANFDKAKVLAVGEEIKDIKEGDIVWCHKIWEELEIGKGVAFISETDIFAVEETASKVAN